MDWEILLAVASSIASIAGLAVAVIQTVRFRAAKRANKELRRSRNTQIWGNIVLALQAFERLEPLKDTHPDVESLPDDVKKRVVAARQSVVDQYLRLLEQAILDENEFTAETVDLWCESGRLENEWRRDHAMKFVTTDNL